MEKERCFVTSRNDKKPTYFRIIGGQVVKLVNK
jgi:hypothetical protein